MKERSSEESKEKARERYHRNPKPKLTAEEERYHRNPKPKLTAEEERYHQNSDRKQAAEWGKYHKNLSLKWQRYNENKAAVNSAEHRDGSIASPAKIMRLQERPTDQHAARSKCYRKDNGLRKISTNKPQRYVRTFEFD